MQFAGVVSEDAPDPRIQQAEFIQLMPVPIVGLIAQPSLEETSVSTEGARDAGGYFAMATSVCYSLWRNPDDRSDPINLSELDQNTWASIENVPPWPRPQWVIEQVEWMRYPQLWEAVKTTWHRDPSEHTSLSMMLVGHVNHILDNRYREARGLGGVP